MQQNSPRPNANKKSTWMLREQEISTSVSSGVFTHFTLHICWSVLIILMLDVSVLVALNSPNAIANPTLALVVRWGKMFLCCCVAVMCCGLFWFHVSCFGHFLFGLALAPGYFSSLQTPLHRHGGACLTIVTACSLLSLRAQLGFCHVGFALFLMIPF